MKLKTSEIIEQSFRDLKVTDIVDFKSLNAVPKIMDNDLSERLEGKLLTYGVFDEYNNKDMISNLQDYEAVEECLSEKRDCSYIESYSYSVYLEISLKKDS